MAGNSYGLLSVEKRVSVPLKSIHVDVCVKGIVASMKAKLSYVNEEENPIEAIFVLPLESGLSICEFRAEIDGRVILGKIEEKEQARQTYDDAISSGQTAFLMEESMDSDDIFKISVGNLPPKKSAEVIFTAVRVLKHLDDGEIQFVLPTILNPRYSPMEHSSQLDNWSQSSPTTPAVGCPYNFSMAAHIETGSKIVEVISPTHDLSVNKEDTKAIVRIEKLEAYAKDVELVIKQEKPFQPMAFIESGEKDCEKGFMASQVIMVNYYPKDVLSKEKKMTPGEYVFIIDRSGSMSGSGIKNARESLILFLKSLPAGSKFNIISFGSRYDFLFSDGSRPYTNATVNEACNEVSSMEANYGGTEILQPLKALFSQKQSGDLKRRVFLITDGEVSNTSAVIALVRQECASGKSRVFTLGIGHGASTALIEGAAKAGLGMAEFAREGSTIQQKVISLVKTASRPFVADVTLKGDLVDLEAGKQIPGSLPHTSLGQSVIAYLLVKQEVSDLANKELKLQYSCSGRVMENIIPLSLCTIPPHDDASQVIHRCAAKQRLEELSSRSDAKKEMTELSQCTNVLCKYTAFIGVDESNQEPIKGSMMQRAIPTLTTGYGGYFGSRAGMAFSGSASLGCQAQQAQPLFGGGGIVCRQMRSLPPPVPCNSASFGGGFGSTTMSACPPPPPGITPLFGGGPPPPPKSSLFEAIETPRVFCKRVAPSQPPPPPPPGGAPLSDSAFQPTLGHAPPPPPPVPAAPFLQSRSTGQQSFGFTESLEGCVSSMESGLKRQRSPAHSSDGGYMGLVTHQNIDGSWQLSEEVARELHTSVDTLRKASPDYLRGQVNGEQIWATALVVVWLECHFKDCSEELSLIVEKAWDWLEEEMGAIGPKEGLQVEAKKALKL